MQMSFRKIAGFLFSAVVVAGSFYVLLELVEVGAVYEVVMRADIALYALAFLFFYLTFPLRAFRWRLLLKGVDVEASRGRANFLLFINWYINTVLPFKAGDLHRAYVGSKDLSASKSRVLGTIAAERLVDVALLASSMLIGFVFFTTLDARMALLASGMLLFILLFSGFVVYFRQEWIPDRVEGIVERFRQGIRSLFSGNHMFLILLVSGVIWGMNVVRMGVVATALDMNLSLVTIVLLAVTVAFLSGLPYTPAGLGVVEVVSTLILAEAGTAESLGFAFIALDRLITVGSLVVLGSFVYIFWKIRGSGFVTGR